MLRRSILVLACLGPLAAVGAGARAAGPDTPLPVEPPKGAPTLEPKRDVPPYIASARRTPAGPDYVERQSYVDGPLAYDVEIVNPTSSTLSTHLLVSRLDVPQALAAVARVPVSVDAASRVTVGFVDAQGLKDGCDATRLRLTLESGTSTRTLRAAPACTFRAESKDPVASLSADMQRAGRRDKLHYHSASLVTPAPSCGAALSVKATVRNDTKDDVQGARLRLDGPVTSASAPFDLAHGKEKIVTVTVPSYVGVPGAYALKLEAPASVAVQQPGFHVDVVRSCRVDVDLER